MKRPEHPNPQFVREAWLNLNGTWDFDFDFGKSARERRFYENGEFTKKIEVPFCPESSLSGIEYKDFMSAVIYRRTFNVPEEWKKSGRTFIHFGAVDYYSEVFVNSKFAGAHRGGYTPFRFDVTELLKDGENTVCVYAEDDVRSGFVPRGKQSEAYNSIGCDYTRTTGIWQTVYLEHTPDDYIVNFKLYPDFDNNALRFEVKTSGEGAVCVKTSFEGKAMGMSEVKTKGFCRGEIYLTEAHPWEIGKGGLYDLELSFGDDKVKSYFGLCSARLSGNEFYLNNKCVFQRTVLDQGFYPEGIYTAPTEEALVNDIVLSMNAGFNGARLHEKVFEPLFLYHADRLGYMVWGEYPNWGFDHTDRGNLAIYASEWCEAVERDFNHPSIIGWCPFNETWDRCGRHRAPEIQSTIYRMTKLFDPVRPVIDVSGGFHTPDTDISDVHDYTQDAEELASHYKDLAIGKAYKAVDAESYHGGPMFVSEYGGIGLKTDSGWSYGEAPKDAEALIERYEALTNVLLDNPNIMGFCYTQLYDIEQEVNGLYTYGREPKVDIERIRRINMREAAIEKNI